MISTGVHVIMKRSLPLAEEFTANHPFIHILIDKKLNDVNVLFCGKLMTISVPKTKSIRDEL